MNGVASKIDSHFKAALFTLAYLLAACTALLLTNGESGVAAIWPASGIGLAGALLLDRMARRTLYGGIFAASIVANILIDLSLWSAILFSIANVAEAIVGRFLIQRFRLLSKDFTSLRTILITGAGAVFVAVFSALVASSLTLQVSVAFVASWASTVFFGLITITPAMMFIAIDVRQHSRSALSLVITALLIASTGIFAFWQTAVPLLWLTIAAAGFATYRLGLTGAALSLLVLTLTGAIYSSAGIGIAVLSDSALSSTLFLQVYLTGVLLALLPLATLLNKYQTSVRELSIAKREAENRAEDARRMAETDFLTGVASRGKVIECLDKEIEHASATGDNLSVMMIDADHFKTINDRFGHAKGDLALIEIASKCKAFALAHGHFGRVGGEEFLLVLPGHVLESAIEIADDLRAELQELPWEENGLAPVTVSIGIAQYRIRQNSSGLLRDADRNLYVAKRAGRDRIFAGKLEASDIHELKRFA
ncbi:diguanylate cyclase [Erythrobacter alti]|uniref:GGDEF domain-containing protein n=1 Tax=Erythrobacter alti TaxID=1896145 RepID=UPI0030F38237